MFFATSVFAQNMEYVKRVSNAYGFLLGQEYSLNIIKKKFPDMKSNIIKVELLFNSNFGKAKNGMKEYLVEAVSKEVFSEMDNILIKQFETMFPSKDITREIVLAFFEEVKGRANGKIETPILETLLSFQYADYPEEEFSAGYKYTFRTKGHPKAKNTDWQIEIPKSWMAKEGIRPNIVQSFVSNYGNGTEMITIMVQAFPKTPFKKEIEKEFSEDEMRKVLLINNIELLSFKNITIDGYPGAMFEHETRQERVDISIKMRMIQFAFIKTDKYYSVQCQVAGLKDEDLSKRMQKYLPLFKMIANSIVVFNQY